MKFITLTFGILLIILASCSNAPEGDKASIQEQQQVTGASGQTMVVDTSNSKIRFTGHGVGKNHPGTFKLTSGQVTINNNQVVGGSFLINIQSLDLDQKGGMFDSKLHPHLLSGDFLDAEQFGTAKFEITKVEPYEPNSGDTSIISGANFIVSGNLTIKDVTKNITFPSKIDLDDNKLTAESKFNIDRTQWKINYGNDKTLGDQFISETVNIELDLEAQKGSSN